MMSMNPSYLAALNRERQADLLLAASKGATSERPGGAGDGATEPFSVRRRTGWLLVDLGLKLALPGAGLLGEAK
jgi:hypothetical protein